MTSNHPDIDDNSDPPDQTISKSDETESPSFSDSTPSTLRRSTRSRKQNKMLNIHNTDSKTYSLLASNVVYDDLTGRLTS